MRADYDADRLPRWTRPTPHPGLDAVVRAWAEASRAHLEEDAEPDAPRDHQPDITETT